MIGAFLTAFWSFEFLISCVTFTTIPFCSYFLIFLQIMIFWAFEFIGRFQNKIVPLNDFLMHSSKNKATFLISSNILEPLFFWIFRLLIRSLISFLNFSPSANQITFPYSCTFNFFQVFLTQHTRCIPNFLWEMKLSISQRWPNFLSHSFAIFIFTCTL